MSAIIYGCTGTGSVKSSGTIDTGVGKVTWSGEASGTIGFSGAPLANLCLEASFSGPDGMAVGSAVTQADGQGNASFDIPAGASSFEIKAVDCPEEEEGEEAPGAAPQGGFSHPLSFIQVFGGPLVADLGRPVDNRYYSFVVQADDFEEADELVQPILAGGIGSRVPASVTVLQFANMIPDALGGARLIQATPSQFTSWEFTLNDGAFSADLFTNVTRYTHNEWDVVETEIPLSALDIGVLSGVTYTNGGAVSYSTQQDPLPVTDSFELSYTN